MTSDPSVVVTVDADITPFEAAMRAAQDSTAGFGKVFTSTIKGAVLSGKSLEDTLRTLALRMSTMALNKALAPVENAVASALNAAIAGATAPAGFAQGGAFAPSGPVPMPITAFAGGGVVGAPTLFSHTGGTGVMGEAGPEAILPLARGADGRLGVAAGGGARPVNVVFNVQANDAASFRRSEGQVTAMLARAVQRGNRGL